MQLEIPFIEEGSLRRRVEAYTDELLTMARLKWPEVRLPRIAVEFRLRGHSAGEACFESDTTNYNEEMLRANGEAFIRRIVPHEVAHIVAHHVFPRAARPHGAEWKAVMEFFGADSSVTHDFASRPARVVRRFAYRCGCDEKHALTRRSHENVRRGRVEYTCRRCGEVLAPIARAPLHRPAS